jgi:hypothetical protein
MRIPIAARHADPAADLLDERCIGERPAVSGDAGQ